VDPAAARRARQKAIKWDLTQAYDDEEAVAPEWVDLGSRVRDTSAEIIRAIEEATEAFSAEPDIRKALERRKRFAKRTRERIEELNTLVARLNLLAPDARFTRPSLDPEEVLKPLFRVSRHK
jgi:hypothetical protein